MGIRFFLGAGINVILNPILTNDPQSLMLFEDLWVPHKALDPHLSHEPIDTECCYLYDKLLRAICTLLLCRRGRCGEETKWDHCLETFPRAELDPFHYFSTDAPKGNTPSLGIQQCHFFSVPHQCGTTWNTIFREIVQQIISGHELRQYVLKSKCMPINPTY